MKLRLTPLNIIIACCIAYAGYLVIYPDKKLFGFATLSVIVMIVLAIIFFITDLIFRNFIKKTSTLWMVELAFIALTTAIMLLINQ